MSTTEVQEPNVSISDLFCSTNRTIFLFNEINDKSAKDIITKLLAFDWNDSSRDIIFYINSLGGSVDSCLAIYDVINFIKSNVVTICIGRAMSAGLYLLMSGTRGKRFITLNSRVCMHQAKSSQSGSVSKLRNETDEVERLQDLLEKIALKHSKLTKKDIKKYMERDSYMSSKETLKLGFVDHIITSPNTLRNNIKL